MKLFNKTIDRQLFKQYALGSDLSKQEVVVKIFNPYSNGTWFIMNSDPNDPDYLWAIVDLGYGAEVGSVSRSDLETYRGRFGLGFERDLSFDPVNAQELYEGLGRGKHYADGGSLTLSKYNNMVEFKAVPSKNYGGKNSLEILNKRNSSGYVVTDSKLELGSIDAGMAKSFFNKNFENGGQIEVVYERRADFKKKPIKLLLLNKGREQKGYTFSGKDQVAVLDNYNRNKQEDLEKLWNLKGYETKYADGGSLGNYDVVIDGDWDEPKKFKTFSLAKKWIYQNAKNYESLELVDPYGDTIFVEGNSTKEDLDWLFSNDEVSAFAKGGNIADFTDNQQMIMNQNVEVEHHHEELEDILQDKVPVPAWVVAKMETATQNLSDITHYLDGEKELMEDENQVRSSEFFPVEDEDEEENEEEDDDQEAIKNQTVVEPINVTAGTKAEMTKNFTDDAMGNLRGFLKGMEGVDLRDDYTFDYKDEQYEVEPIINSDENGVSNAVFTIFDGDGEEVGDVAYSREGGKQKFTANSEFFSWNNAKFEDGGFMNGVYADGGEITLWKSKPKNKPEKFKTFKSLQAYKTYMTKNAEFFRDEHSKNGTGFHGFDADVTEKEVESSLQNLYDSNNQYADGGYFDGTIPKVSTYMSNYAKGGEVAKAEILGLSKNIMGTTDIEMKISGMRKSQSFIVYPISKDDSGDIITIQSETRIGKIDLSSGRGLMSQSHSNGAYFVHFQMDKLTPFTISESDLEDLKMQIFKTAGDNVGSRGIVSDNSGASRIFAKGGKIDFKERSERDSLKLAKAYQKVLDSDFDETEYKKYIEIVKETQIPNEELQKIELYISTTPKGQRRMIDTYRYWAKSQYADGGFMSDVYAKGGMVVTSVKDIPNFTERLEQRRITYRGLGMGKVADDFYKLAGTGGTRIKVDGKEYFITDEEFDTFSRGADGKMQIRFDAPARKNENGGFMNDVYADGGSFDDFDGITYAKTKGRNSIDWDKEVREYAGSDYDNLTKQEYEEIVSFLQRDWDRSYSYADGGFMNDVYADGGELSNYTVTIVYPRLPLKGERSNWAYNENIDLDVLAKNETQAKKKALIKFSEMFPNEKPSITSVNSNRYKFLDKAELQDGGSFAPNVSDGTRFMSGVYAKGGTLKKYILKADIKTVTVKRNGKEVTYKGADVLNGANVLAKGGDISSKANYIPKRDVVEVELNDGSKVKPVNGYWVKKGAEPIGAEPTPTSSGSSETKIGTTQIRKDMRGNWRAETNIDNFNDYDWRLSTVKTYSGNLVSSAQGGKTEATGTKGIVMFKYTMYQDPNHTLEVSKPKRLTDKVVTEQHDKALTKFKKFMETGMFKGGGKISNFDKLSDKVAKEYEGKPVKGKYQEEYGKYYSKEEAQEVGDKVAGKMKLMTADKKAFGGLFGGAKSLITKPKFPQLDGKQVALKSGKYVQVFSQSGSNLTVLDLGKIGTGERPYKIDISEVDMNSFKAGGNVAGKKANRGTETLKKANELAKKIRKDGESWLDAKKRAFAQLKSV